MAIRDYRNVGLGLVLGGFTAMPEACAQTTLIRVAQAPAERTDEALELFGSNVLGVSAHGRRHTPGAVLAR